MHISIPWKINFHYRSTLRGTDGDAYNAILTGLQDWAPKIKLPGCMDIHRAYDIYLMVLKDVPMYFHVSNLATYLGTGSLTLTPNYTMSESEYRNTFSKVEQFLRNAGNKLSGLSAFEQLQSLHNSMLRHVNYHDTESNNEHNVLGAILERKAVCESIAKAYKALCDYVGIPAVVVFGKAQDLNSNNPEPDDDGDNHAWNLVRLDGKWYCVDVTFDLGLMGDDKTNIPRYDYFLRSSKKFSSDHHTSDTYKIINCPEDFFTYRKMGQAVASMEDVKKLTKKLIKAGKTTITFELEPGFSASANTLSDCVLNATPLFRFHSIQYSYNEAMRVFRAKLL